MHTYLGRDPQQDQLKRAPGHPKQWHQGHPGLHCLHFHVEGTHQHAGNSVPHLNDQTQSSRQHTC